MSQRRIYLIGSLRNPEIPRIAEDIRRMGHEVFDEWFSAGEKADEEWEKHQKAKGLTYRQAINGPHAKCVFDFDQAWLRWADTVVLALPAGKSGHLEFGWSLGQGKEGFILMDGEPQRWDVMYRFADGIAFSIPELRMILED